MSDRRWKRTEREVAAALGGRRVPVTGRRGADVEHPTLAPEVKSRAELPRWLVEAVAQARAGAAEGRLPIVVLHQVGDRHGEDLVVVRFADWCDWFGSLERAPAEVAR